MQTRINDATNKRTPISTGATSVQKWNPKRKRKRGRIRNAWRCDLETDTPKMGNSSWKGWPRTEDCEQLLLVAQILKKIMCMSEFTLTLKSCGDNFLQHSMTFVECVVIDIRNLLSLISLLFKARRASYHSCLNLGELVICFFQHSNFAVLVFLDFHILKSKCSSMTKAIRVAVYFDFESWRAIYMQC